MSAKPATKKTKDHRGLYIQATVLALLIALLIPQIPSLKQGVHVLKTTDIWVFLLACIVFSFTYLWAAICFGILAFKPVSLKKLYIVQWAGGFANKLVPAGIGSLSFNTLFLVKSGHNQGESGTISLVNNVLGWLSSTLLLTLVVVTWGSSQQQAVDAVAITPQKLLLVAGVLLFIAVTVSVVFSMHTGAREKLKQWRMQSSSALKMYVKRPARLVFALCTQLLITITYSFVLFLCARAIGLDVRVTQALVVVSLGIALGSSVPTPGGIGGVEAGMVAALILLDVQKDTAIAAVLLFRLASFWFPLIPGYVAYRYSLTRGYYKSR